MSPTLTTFNEPKLFCCYPIGYIHITTFQATEKVNVSKAHQLMAIDELH
jgi:hypothetical protein